MKGHIIPFKDDRYRDIQSDHQNRMNRSLKTNRNKTAQVELSVIKESNHSRGALQIAVIAISRKYQR